ncbi:MAG: sigma 54-interacting transcriptional regulator [Desulfuromonadales bacterium]
MIQPQNFRILLVDDEEGIRFTIGCLLKQEGYQVDTAASHIDAIAHFQSCHYDLCLVDISLGASNGIDVLRDIKTVSPSTQVIMFTGHPEISTAAEAVRLGAFDYITKPVQPRALKSVCQLALNEKQLTDERERYRANLDAIFNSISDSIIMIDANGCLAQFNATAAASCGYTDELIGREAAGIEFGCEGLCRTALLETLRSSTPREVRRFECHRPDGTLCIVSFKSTPITASDGTATGAVAVIRDETPLVELEHSLMRRGQFHGIIGISEQMQRVYSLIEALADVPTTVLIHGESGTGKELVAAALHHAGDRAKGPFVKVNCSALSESLLESELFGHVRGAFTGAVADKVGRFQKAHRGTLFLDEIGDITPAVQMRLLRVLQESEFERVGESKSTKVDVRVVAASHQNLAELVKQGRFRQDLYFRLNVVKIELPALRERREDIGLLCDHFLDAFNRKFSKNVHALSDEAVRLLRTYSWPGNVRELQHAIEHAVILCKGDTVTRQHLPQELTDAATGAAPPAARCSGTLTLEEALVIANGNKARAARLMGVSRQTVYRHLKGDGRE